MFIIDNILGDDTILTQPFLCDLKRCKGACCTVKGGSGAPLLDSEVALITAAVPVAWEYLSARSRQEITAQGAFEGTEGEYGTTCIDDADCVFVYYDRGSDIAKCAIEQAYNDGKTSFRKPISCHLFPVRVADFNGTYLYYEEFDECKPAIANGNANDAKVYDCVKDALVRSYGDEWFGKLRELAERESKTSVQQATKTVTKTATKTVTKQP